MATSDPGGIPSILHETYRLNPTSVLDCGAGAGKYGALLREYLDHAHGRFQRPQWYTRIDAVEGFKDYITDLHRAVYDHVWIEDFVGRTYSNYDLVLMIDSLEHLDKFVGEETLDGLLRRNKHMIISVPMGDYYRPQGAEHGNEFERHRAEWFKSDFTKRGGIQIYQSVCGVFSIPGGR